MEIYNEVLNESTGDVFYHGTSEWLPFEEFLPRMDGHGAVSSGGKKYGGFFFTSNKKNAEYYGEYLIATVKIREYETLTNTTHPPTMLKQAIVDKKIYRVDNVLDGSAYSDVIVVPHSELSKVQIVKWELTNGSEHDWISTLNEKFTWIQYGWDDEAEEETDEGEVMKPTQWDVSETMNQMDGIDYVLTFPPFKKWYDSLDGG